MRKLIAVLFVCFLMISPATLAQTPEPAVSIDNPMLPDFNCTDTSYADAVANGITLGITPDFPYTYLDSSNEPQGIDVAINKAVLDWVGITDVTFETMPWDSLIPALQAEQIDVIADNIHETPDRVKVMGFTVSRLVVWPGVDRHQRQPGQHSVVRRSHAGWRDGGRGQRFGRGGIPQFHRG